jgi:hypothetical protein
MQRRRFVLRVDELTPDRRPGTYQARSAGGFVFANSTVVALLTIGVA